MQKILEAVFHKWKMPQTLSQPAQTAVMNGKPITHSDRYSCDFVPTLFYRI